MSAIHPSIEKLLSPIIIVFFWALVVGASLAWNVYDEKSHTLDFAKQRGQMVVDVVVATRLWAAKHGGVYAPITTDTPPNPYLKIKEKNIFTPSGVALTLVNPAYMTRQIAEVMADTSINIHMTSLKPLNPLNKPDEWERGALLDFEKGTKQKIGYRTQDEGSTFNFMSPLYVEKPCMACHEHQGYEIGDVRGGLRVSFPSQSIMDREENRIQAMTWTHVGAFLLLSILSISFSSKVKKLLADLKAERDNRDRIIAEQTEELTKLATIDSLTGIKNRRMLDTFLLDEFNRSKRYKDVFCLTLIDLDHFKKINDTFGHHIGDRVLQDFCDKVSEHLRNTDMLARYGGEEFAIIMPHTPGPNAWESVNRIREHIDQELFQIEKNVVPLTMSFGLAAFDPELFKSPDDILRAADQALYEAKTTGRNKGVIFKNWDKN